MMLSFFSGKGQFYARRNPRIMQALSCALLVAAANGFYSPQQKAKVAPRALARAAKEGQAAAGEKQRIVQRSVVKTRQLHHELRIYDDSQQRA